MPVDTQKRRELVQTLQSQGFLKPSRRGRPPIYSSPEERREALLEQKRACNRRYAEKLRLAKELLQKNIASQ